jgi:hypothetical protein
MLKMDPKSFQDFIQKVQNNSYNLIYIISPSKEMNDTFLKEAIDNLSAASRIDRLVGNDSTSALITNSSFSEKIPKVYISKDPVDITTSFDFFINRFTYIFMHNRVQLQVETLECLVNFLRYKRTPLTEKVPSAQY